MVQPNFHQSSLYSIHKLDFSVVISRANAASEFWVFLASLLQSSVCEILLIRSHLMLSFFYLYLQDKALSKMFLWIGDLLPL